MVGWRSCSRRTRASLRSSSYTSGIWSPVAPGPPSGVPSADMWTRIMTPDAIGRIRASYVDVAARPRQFAARFYEELFAAAPQLRPLFPADLGTLQGHFEAAIG